MSLKLVSDKPPRLGAGLGVWNATGSSKNGAVKCQDSSTLDKLPLRQPRHPLFVLRGTASGTYMLQAQCRTWPSRSAGCRGGAVCAKEPARAGEELHQVGRGRKSQKGQIDTLWGFPGEALKQLAQYNVLSWGVW